MEKYVKIRQTGMIHYIVKTQAAGDASEETIRSVMKVHGCHRLHTKKEERVMLLLVSAYLASGVQCMPRGVLVLNSIGQCYQKCWRVSYFKGLVQSLQDFADFQKYRDQNFNLTKHLNLKKINARHALMRNYGYIAAISFYQINKINIPKNLYYVLLCVIKRLKIF